MSETNLSTFLHIVHDCMSDESKISGQEMVRQLLDIQKINIYGEEKFKGIYTGARPIIPSDVEDKTKKDKIPEFKKYFISILDEDKTQTLFAKFGIEKDEKVDFALMCEAIAMQYQNFTRYGDLANTTVKSIYEVLIDKDGYSADPDANEKAIKASYELLLNAVVHLSRVNPVLDQISDVKEPIESFLMTIAQVYGVLFARMNRLGRITYKSLREKYIRKNSKADKYIKMASEPGALPIELIRGLEVVAYDLPKNKDYFIGGEADLDEEYTKEDLITGLEGIKELKDYIEIYFTEFTFYHLKNEKDSLVDSVYLLVMITRDFLKQLSSDLRIKTPSKILDDISKKYADVERLSIAFAFDGSYYRPTKTITYAPTIEFMMYNDDGSVVRTGQDRFTFDKRSHFFGETLDEVIQKFTAHQIALYQEMKEDPMNEVLVINSDRTYRYYMFFNTCKAKTYRKIREIAAVGFEEHAIAILTQAINVVHFEDKDTSNLMFLPTQERVEAPGGLDVLTIFAATWDGIKTREYKCEELKKNIIKQWKTDTIYYLYKPFLLMLAGNRAEGYSYTSVFKDKEKPLPKKPDSE